MQGVDDNRKNHSITLQKDNIINQYNL